MQKTKLGISVGLLGAALYFTCFFGGYTAAIILAGYILLFEEDSWLKRTTVKGVALMFGFAILSSLIYLIPNAIGIIDSIFSIFGGNFYISFVSNIINVIMDVLTVIEKLLFIALGIKALKQETIEITVIDSLVSKYMD